MEPLVRIIYLDAQFEMDEDLEQRPLPCTNTVVGWQLDERLRDHLSIASEHTPHGWRAITHIPNGNVLLRKELT